MADSLLVAGAFACIVLATAAAMFLTAACCRLRPDHLELDHLRGFALSCGAGIGAALLALMGVTMLLNWLA